MTQNKEFVLKIPTTKNLIIPRIACTLPDLKLGFQMDFSNLN